MRKILIAFVVTFIVAGGILAMWNPFASERELPLAPTLQIDD